jgi:hypothetical protein
MLLTDFLGCAQVIQIDPAKVRITSELCENKKGPEKTLLRVASPV